MYVLIFEYMMFRGEIVTIPLPYCVQHSHHHHHGQKEEVYSIRRDAITVYWHKKCSSKNVVLLFPLICENSKTCLEKIMINPSKKDVYLIIMITGKSYSNPSVCLIDNNIWPSSFSIENRWCRYSNNAKMLWFYNPFIHKTM